MKRQQFETEFISPVTICDIEIGNNIIDSKGFWNYLNSDIITLGLFSGNKITILQREKEDKEEFWKEYLLKELKNVPAMFCFNTKMEKGSLIGYLNLSRFFEEIQPFCGKGCNKDNFFNDILKDNLVPEIFIPKDPLKGDGSKVQGKYEDGKYEDIILHNKSCLIKEYWIFINKFKILKKYGPNIENGWWVGLMPFGK